MRISRFFIPQAIVDEANNLDLAQLERLHGWVLELVEERREALEAKLRDRRLKEMQRLLDQAGISMDEFQEALGDMDE